MLGRPETEVAEAIRELEEKRIILKYPALINWDKVESGEVEALIEVRVTPQRDHGFDASPSRSTALRRCATSTSCPAATTSW